MWLGWLTITSLQTFGVCPLMTFRGFTVNYHEAPEQGYVTSSFSSYPTISWKNILSCSLDIAHVRLLLFHSSPFYPISITSPGYPPCRRLIQPILRNRIGLNLYWYQYCAFLKLVLITLSIQPALSAVTRINWMYSITKESAALSISWIHTRFFL